MKALIIYDSVYGNTEKIALGIGAGLGTPEEVEAIRATGATPERLRAADVVVVGAPTQGFRPTKPVQEFLSALSGDALKGKQVAAFDTRMGGKEASGFVRMVVKVGGYAAPRIADTLKKKGGALLVPADGFFVKDREGPLVEGELERATTWGKTIRAATNRD